MRDNFSWRRSLAFEPLENRRLLALVVNTLVDEADGSITDGDVSLRDAIALAPAGETINFAPALTASGPAVIKLTKGELLINKSLSIVGPGVKLLSVDARGNDITPLFFTGNGSHVFRIDDGLGTRADVLIQGITITGADHSGYGGAIRTNESLTIRDAIFQHNGGADGGAIGSNGPLFVYDSEFFDNHAKNGGGAINLINGGTGQFVRTTMHDNEGAGPGGAIFAISDRFGLVTIVDSLVKDNVAGGIGGGIYSQGPLSVVGSSIFGNQSGGDGGGLYAKRSLIVSHSLVANNRIVNNELSPLIGNGGGIYAGLHATISDTTIINNTARRSGGGLYVEGDTTAVEPLVITVTSSTFTGNVASRSGGGVHTNWPMVFRHSTIAFNSASGVDLSVGGLVSGGAGGGIYFRETAFSGGVDLSHTIVSNNSHGVTANDLGSYKYLSLVTSTFAFDGSLVREVTGFDQAFVIGTSTPSLLGVDPKLLPLSESGQLLPGGYRLPTFDLAPDSPAINAGNPALAAGLGGVPQFDQRGTPWSRVAGGRIDMGAVESQANPLPGDYNFNGVVDAADYVVWRNSVGSNSRFQADGSSAVVGVPDGVVDTFDYAFWKSNFGNMLELGAGSGELGNGAAAGEQEPEAVAAMAADGLDAGIAAVAAPANRRDVARHRSGHHAGEPRDARADALVAWLAGRRNTTAGDEICEQSPTETPSDATDQVPTALDAAFELLGSAG